MLHENAIKKVKSQPGTNMAELVTKESSSSSFFFFFVIPTEFLKTEKKKARNGDKA
jgi:hypothetical protein